MRRGSDEKFFLTIECEERLSLEISLELLLMNFGFISASKFGEKKLTLEFFQLVNEGLIIDEINCSEMMFLVFIVIS